MKGRMLNPAAAHQDAANALGINPTRFKLVPLILSAFLTGLLGGFFAPYQGYIDPDVVFSIPDISIAMIVVAVLGGMGNLWGPPVGAIIVVVLSEILRATLGEAHLLVYAALMIAIVVFLPEGLSAGSRGSSPAGRRAAGLARPPRRIGRPRPLP